MIAEELGQPLNGADMQESTAHESSKRHVRWIILATVIGILALLAVVPGIEYVRIRLAMRDLGNPSRCRAAAASLVAMGTRGRIAAIRAIGQDVPGSFIAAEALAAAIKKDITEGRDIAPLVRAAAEGILKAANGPSSRFAVEELVDDIKSSFPKPGAAAGLGRSDAQKFCAGIASEVWALGLLDEETKTAIVRLALEPGLTARPEYPLGKGQPSFHVDWNPLSGRLSSSLRFSISGAFTVDGQTYVTGPSEVETSGSYGLGCGSPVRSYGLGRHTLQGRAEAILTKVLGPGGQPVDSPEVGWKMSIDTPEVTVAIRDDLTETFLQAKVTPELTELVGRAVQIRAEKSGRSSSSSEGRTVRLESFYIHVDPPLPIDLAFRIRHNVLETGEEFTSWGSSVLRNSTQGSNLCDFGRDWMGKLPAGKHTFTFKITLEPSLEAALADPKVEAYWPLPIELPPVEREIEVKER